MGERTESLANPRVMITAGLVLLPIFAVSFLENEIQQYVVGAAILGLALMAASWFKGLSKNHKPVRDRFTLESTAIQAMQNGLADKSQTHGVACIMIEIDDFDRLSGDWGPAGTALILDEFADRVFSFFRIDDIVVRKGRARFAVALPSVRRPELGAVLGIIDRLQQAFAEPIVVEGSSAYITLTAGFCIETMAPTRTGLKIMEGAEAALEEAQCFGPSAVRSYSGKNRRLRGAPSELVSDFLEAAQHGKIIAWFQPQVSTSTGQLTGFEALVRWDDEVRGLVAPSDFLPALEAEGRMEELSEVMVNNALMAIRSWDRAGLVVPSVAVNFSTQELRNPSLIDRVKWDVDRFDLTPDRLTIEILETVISDTHDDIVAKNIRALSEAGFSVDLDDFGKGSASLANIRRFNVGRIKIDRSFVTNLDHDAEQQRMLSAIIAMAEQLGIETLAEGVETLGEKSLISQLGCSAMQGYAVAPPMPFEDTISWLSAHRQKLKNTIAFPSRTG